MSHWIQIPATTINFEDGRSMAVPPFLVRRHRISATEFLEFTQSTGYVTTAEKENPFHCFRRWHGLEELSIAEQLAADVVLVSWHDVLAYANWAGYFPITEAQWLAASVRDWKTEIQLPPRTVDVDESPYLLNENQMLVDGPEWVLGECAGDQAVIRRRPRYALTVGWTAEVSRNRHVAPHHYFGPSIGFRLGRSAF